MDQFIFLWSWKLYKVFNCFQFNFLASVKITLTSTEKYHQQRWKWSEEKNLLFQLQREKIWFCLNVMEFLMKITRLAFFSFWYLTTHVHGQNSITERKRNFLCSEIFSHNNNQNIYGQFFLWGHEKWSLNVYDKKLSKFFYPDVTQNAKRLRVIKRGTRFWPKCQQIKFEDIKKKRQKVG